MNRLIATLLLLAALALVPAGAGAVCIQFWTTENEPDRIPVISYLADAFMALNDDVRVQVVFFDENELPFAMARAVQRDRMPGLVYTGSEHLVAFARRGWLDGKLAGAVADGIGRERFSAGALRCLTEPGTGNLYGLPYHGWVQGIWYRADWFKEAGLEPPDSMERIMAAAEKLHDPAADRYGLLIGTGQDVYAEQVFTHLALAQGVREFDGQGRLVFNTPRTVRLLADYVRLARFTPPGANSWRARDYYLQGKLAMMFYSSFIMDDLALSSVAANSLTGDNFPDLKGARFDPNLLTNTEMVSVLGDRRPSSYGVVVGLGFGRGLDYDQREAAMGLARFLFRTDAYVTWLHMAPGGMLPVLHDVADMDVFYRDLQGVFRRYGHAKVQEVVRGLEQVRSFSMDNGHLNTDAAEIMARGIIPAMIHKALHEGVPPAEAVAWAEGEMREALDRN
ncbi:ABC transporter substrate-binding protein [Desulfocurvus sp. DL9XJH121]